MTVIIISSTTDPASTHIKESLLEYMTWEETDLFYNNPVYTNETFKDIVLVTINDNKIQHEHIDKEVKDQLNITPKQAIFLSRHRSKMATPSLTVHPIGNYGEAQFGGKDKTIIESSPQLMTSLLRRINKNLQKTSLNYHVCFEVTHHGPYLEIPTFFVEVGSTEHEWKQKEPAHGFASEGNHHNRDAQERRILHGYGRQMAPGRRA